MKNIEPNSLDLVYGRDCKEIRHWHDSFRLHRVLQHLSMATVFRLLFFGTAVTT